MRDAFAGTRPMTGRTLTDFEGAWRFERRISDARLPEATVQGSAEWAAHAHGLMYRETGLLHLPGQPPMQATRSYLWRDDLRVFFDDGRFFHTVPPMGGEAVHDCPPDTYRVRYEFADWPCFETYWHVTGPRKDYRMRTRYVLDQAP